MIKLDEQRTQAHPRGNASGAVGESRTDAAMRVVDPNVAPEAVERAVELAAVNLEAVDRATVDRAAVDPAAVDLEELRGVLRRACGASVARAVVGRTRLREEIRRHLGCSALVAERLVDAMIGRGFIRQQVHRDGWVYWAMH